MEPSEHRVSADEWSLAAREYPASGAARGAVIIGHAAACNSKTLDRPAGNGLASTLAQAGLHVYTFDIRGHGNSTPRAAEGGRWTYDDILRGDIAAMVAWVHERHPDLRLGLLGHSLTGHASLFWLGQNPDAPVDALVVYSANVWLPRFESERMRWFKKRATLALWSALCRTFGYLPTRRFRMGTDDESADMVRSFKRWAKTNTCTRQSDGADYLASLEGVRQPVLAFMGEHDRFLCTEESCRGLLAAVPDHNVKVVPEADHMSLVTRERSRPVWDETAAWFVEQFDRAGGES